MMCASSTTSPFPSSLLLYGLHCCFYRSLSQFQLPSSLFKDPELINAPERCGLALFNIDTQALEGLWEATFCDVAADRVGVSAVQFWILSEAVLQIGLRL